MAQGSVTVVIPCYQIAHRQEILREAIQSVIAQTHQCAEILIVDDGSSDGSAEVASRLVTELDIPAQTEARVISLKENGGPSLARNAGIDAAQSDFVAFLDFDDLYLPSFIETALAQFESDTEWEVVLAPAYFYKNRDGKEKVVFEEISPEINSQPFEELIAYTLKANFPTPMGSSLIVKRGVFEANPDLRYDEWLSKRTAEDVHFSYLFLLKGIRPYFLSTPLVVHRTYFHHGSRGYSAFLKLDELEVFEYINSKVMPVLREKLVAYSGELTKEVEKSMERKREQFQVKSLFLKRHYLRSLVFAMQSPRRMKDWLNYFLLVISSLPILSGLRSLFEFNRISSNDGALEEVRVLFSKLKSHS